MYYKHLRLGDGELQAAQYDGTGPSANCDGVRYTPELAEALQNLPVPGRGADVWHWPYQPQALYEAQWPHLSFSGSDGYESYMLTTSTDLEHLREFWQYLKNSDLTIRVIASPAVCQVIKDKIPRAETHPIPSNLTYVPIMPPYGERDVIIGAGGPWIKPLLFELAAKDDCDVVDLGSGLDPVAYDKPTRIGQLSHKDALNFWASV